MYVNSFEYLDVVGLATGTVRKGTHTIEIVLQLSPYARQDTVGSSSITECQLTVKRD